MKWAAQLYTVREHVKTAEGFEKALERVHEMGYQGVQISAVEAFEKFVSPAETAKWLQKYNLTCCATHRPWDKLLNETDKEIETHKTIGCTHIGIGMGPKSCFEKGPEGWREFLVDVQKVCERFDKHGLTFCYHNHAVEWEVKGGKRGIEILMSESDHRLQFILDTYWVVHGGADCVHTIEQLKGKIDCVHLKDKSVKGSETRMAPVGRGNLNWGGILPALNHAGTEWGIVEQDDCYGEDPFECLNESLRYLETTK